MNIATKIATRKVTLVLIYQMLIKNLSVAKNYASYRDFFYVNTNNINTNKTNDYHSTYYDWFLFAYNHYANEEVLSNEISYIVDNFFSYKKKINIDFNYINDTLMYICPRMQDIFYYINIYTKSFPIERMHFIDQSIFIMMYAELQTLDTPKEIILNEWIELAKRYWNTWSQKIINWILHKLAFYQQ